MRGGKRGRRKEEERGKERIKKKVGKGKEKDLFVFSSLSAF